MNRGLMVFALLMIAFGVAFNIYLLSLIGVLIFFPALISRPRQPQGPPPVSSGPETRRMPPPRLIKTVAPAPAAQQMPKAAVSISPPAPPQSPAYAPALFPTAIFPSLSLMGSPPQNNEQAPPANAPERDEVVEMGAVLALLKLVLG